jgi:hypothetical protein
MKPEEIVIEIKNPYGIDHQFTSSINKWVSNILLLMPSPSK